MSYTNIDTCTYCKEDGHTKWNCSKLKEKKQLVRSQQKWERLIKKWGHDDTALDALYTDGDEAHGIGFRAFLDTIIVHRDVLHTAMKKPQHAGIFDVLEIDEPLHHQHQEETEREPPRTMNFAEIMREQQCGC